LALCVTAKWFEPKCDKFSRRLALALSFLIAAPGHIVGTATAAALVAVAHVAAA